MEQIKNPLQLEVGPFSVNVIYEPAYTDCNVLPDSASEFIKPSGNYQHGPDFNYIISNENLPDENSRVYLSGCRNGPNPYQIYEIGYGNYLWIRNKANDMLMLAFLITDKWSTWKLIQDRSGSDGTDSFAELAYIFAYSILNKSGIMFHGVAMEWNRGGIIVCAHSGIGKSTHTRMWKSLENARILNGDRAVCYKEGNEWFTCGAPWCGSSGEYRNESVALKAIILLERSDNNRVTLLSPLQGGMGLLELAFAPSWEEKLMNASIDRIDDIVGKVPVYRLSCLPDYEAVTLLKEELQHAGFV